MQPLARLAGEVLPLRTPLPMAKAEFPFVYDLLSFNVFEGLLGETLTRASNGTIVANGAVRELSTNIPRINEHGVLIEGASTNQCAQSEDFSTIWVIATSSIDITTNIISAPDGTLTADELSDAANSGYHQLYYPRTLSGGAVQNTFSIFAKAGTGTDITLVPYNGTDLVVGSISFDLSDGSITANDTNLVDDYGVEEIGNGWYRCWVTSTPTVAVNNFYLRLTNGTYLGDGTNAVYVWGAQVEELAFPSSYIPTAGSTVTRADESLTYDLSAASWFNDGGGGTMIGEFYLTHPQVNGYIADIRLSGSKLIVAHIHSTGNQFRFTIVDTTTQAAIVNPTLTFPNTFKFGVAWNANDCASYVDGTQAGTDTTASIPSGLTTLSIGNAVGSVHLNGYIKNFKYFPYRMSNADLARLTA